MTRDRSAFSWITSAISLVRVVRSWTGHAGDGSDPGSLHPWRVVVRTAGLPNGHYVVVAEGPDVTDPSVTVHDARSLRLAGHHH
jgi:hypothetical protein